jgi:hypothetical protein
MNICRVAAGLNKTRTIKPTDGTISVGPRKHARFANTGKNNVAA